MVTARGPSDARALSLAAPPRTLLDKVNSHLICVLCRGYYIDATTIVECLHTFCRSCIVKHLRVKSYCPVCEMMINSARPNIKLDKALQDIVYKLVPGLFQREMARRRAFYASRPDLAADVTPEQRGEDTERIVFSPDDVISFSLEFADPNREADSSESGSGSGGESTPSPPEDEPVATATRRYLRCPAVVNISHLKKFLSLKFDIDVGHFFVDILYKRVPLPDYYTLMDVAYIYNWKRIEPMRFFYQISDFSPIRDRFGFLEARSARREDGDGGPAPGDEPKRGPPTDPPGKPPGDRAPPGDARSRDDRPAQGEDAEKSQFLNSFELKAKTGPNGSPGSPAKERDDERKPKEESPKSTPAVEKKDTGTDKRRPAAPGPDRSPDAKRRKLEALDAALRNSTSTPPEIPLRRIDRPPSSAKSQSILDSLKKEPSAYKFQSPSQNQKRLPDSLPLQAMKIKKSPPPVNDSDNKNKSSPSKTISFSLKKRKASDSEDPQASKVERGNAQNINMDKIKIRTPEGINESKHILPNESSSSPSIKTEIPNKIPRQPMQKPESMKKPESSVKRSEPSKDTQRLMAIKPKKPEGENPLRSLFNSCNINIPPSLSITLKDQEIAKKQEGIKETTEPKSHSQQALKPTAASTQTQASSQAPGSIDKNYLEIIKLPDAENQKSSPPGQGSKSSQKSLEALVTAKGPIPNLKPISEAKNVPFSKPQTFQQTFLQSLQQQKDKSKYKPRMVHPKVSLLKLKQEDSSDSSGQTQTKPAAPPLLKVQNVPLAPQIPKMNPLPKAIKSDSALDLSTPHPMHTKLGPQQTKALETMQSIAILAKKQCFNQRTGQNFSQDAFKLNSSNPEIPLRVPIPASTNTMKMSNTSQNNSAESPKPFSEYFQNLNKSMVRSPSESGSKPVKSPSPVNQNNERSQTRSPSSSPKLVIACPSPKSQSPEQKQFISPKISETSSSQSTTISSSQITSSNPSVEASGSKDNSKMIRNAKPQPMNKLNQVSNSNLNSNPLKPNNPNDLMSIPPHLLAQHAYIRQQLELQTHLGLLPSGAASQWFSNPLVRTHFENIVKNMAQNSQFNNSHNPKDK